MTISRKGDMRIETLILRAISMGTIPIAVYMIVDTAKTFPDASFLDRLPGFVLFPLIILLVGALAFMRGECRR